MSIDALLNLAIIIVVAGVIFWLIWWFIDWIGLPEPFNKVAKVLVGLVALIFLVKILLSLIGGGGFSLSMLTMKVLT
jgi:hypothetical protein